MATNVKATTKNNSPMKVGKNPNNLPADSYAKNGTSVAVSRSVTGHGMVDPNTLASNQTGPGGMSARRVSVGDIASSPKTSGIETRGNGAATKGRIARGPMA